MTETKNNSNGHTKIEPTKPTSGHIPIIEKCGTLGHKRIRKEILIEEIMAISTAAMNQRIADLSKCVFPGIDGIEYE